ncbi:UNVERIFIED_CONTAM: hypothetical protein Slati_0994000 [Sesamum latifolium]|uniref:Uncharacterized protein n=1 Tax=Sesamum latifolium TaxID=2727402 RepID=A0AAW2XSF7_9LAMI
MIDERLLGHFGLSSHVEPLDEPLVDIMFKKYFRNLSDKEKEKGGGAPPSRSARDLCLQCLQGKEAYVSLRGTPSEGPAKRTMAS